MKKFLALLSFILLASSVSADETISSGLTLTIPSQGSRGWGTTFKNSFATPISAHDHTGGGKGVQISTNAVAANAVTDPKIRLTNNGYLRGRNATNSADVNIVKVNASDQIEFASVPLNGIPPGVFFPYGGTSAPTGYLLCDGSAVSRSTYAALFTAIGTAYGAGNGTTTFNVPDMQQRFPLGKAASGTGSTLGGTGGSIDHTHSSPAHYHGMGTGADLNLTSGGSHSHSIDHDHASTLTNSQGAHTHFTINDDLTSTAVSASNRIGRSYDATNDFSYELKGSNTAADRGLTSSEGAHTHALDLANLTGTSGGASHTHATGEFAGRIGLVTGGVDGNAAMTTGANNAPFQTANFIIKY